MDHGLEAGDRTRVSQRVLRAVGGAGIARTFDYKIVRALAVDPAIFPHISDDFTSDPKQWKPIESESVVYLVASDKEGPCGIGVFLPDTWACWKAHIAFLPRSYGADALGRFREMLAWMWQHTQARRIVGEIRRDNTLAIRFARRAGFAVYGINRKSYLKNGVLLDQFCLGISKPE